jgi:indolepyruvate ferredoxin oxidoreductase beta subunit
MKSFRIVVAGVGGQGSLTAGRLIAEAALADNQNVLASEIHGMSQRGGIVESTVVIGEAKSPLIALGQADVILSFEPVEAVRCLEFASKKTVAIVSTAKVVPFSVSMGQATYPPLDEALALIKKHVKTLVAFDAEDLAAKSGSPRALNSVLIGALSATGVLPIDADVLKKTVLDLVPQKFRKENQKAFGLGEKAAIKG